jgi:hypothetical protein
VIGAPSRLSVEIPTIKFVYYVYYESMKRKLGVSLYMSVGVNWRKEVERSFFFKKKKETKKKTQIVLS